MDHVVLKVHNNFINAYIVSVYHVYDTKNDIGETPVPWDGRYSNPF